MWELALAIRHRGCPVSDVSAGNPSVRVQNVSKAGQTGVKAKRLIALYGEPADIDRFADSFERHETVEWIEWLSDGGENLRYASTSVDYPPDNPGIMDILDAHACYQHTAVAVAEGIEYWVIYLEEGNGGVDVVSDIESYGNDVELVRRVNLTDISEVATLGYASILFELTPKQRAAFRTALELGYYDPAKDVVVDDIASVVDVHRTTAWEHLKKAQNVVLSEVGNHLFPQSAEPVQFP